MLVSIKSFQRVSALAVAALVALVMAAALTSSASAAACDATPCESSSSKYQSKITVRNFTGKDLAFSAANSWIKSPGLFNYNTGHFAEGHAPTAIVSGNDLLVIGHGRARHLDMHLVFFDPTNRANVVTITSHRDVKNYPDQVFTNTSGSMRAETSKANTASVGNVNYANATVTLTTPFLF